MAKKRPGRKPRRPTLTLPSVPAASASCEMHADWLEYCALRTPGREVSRNDFITEIEISGSVDALDGDSDDEDDEIPHSGKVEILADSAFSELEERERACDGKYPFTLDGNTIRFAPTQDEALYVFLFLLSTFGRDVGPQGTHGERIFEETSARALEAYLGGVKPHVGSIVFGSPRPVPPVGFADALNKLCVEMGEGEQHKSHPLNSEQKDAGVDVIAWRHFADRRKGKLIVFGQCATGADWERKAVPSPQDWCALWLVATPFVWPIKTLFVPHRLDSDRWELACRLLGVVFDRCRIVHLLADTADERQRWSAWAVHVLSQLRSATAGSAA